MTAVERGAVAARRVEARRLRVAAACELAHGRDPGPLSGLADAIDGRLSAGDRPRGWLVNPGGALACSACARAPRPGTWRVPLFAGDLAGQRDADAVCDRCLTFIDSLLRRPGR